MHMVITPISDPGPPSAVTGGSVVQLLDGSLQNNAGGGVSPQSASGVRVSVGFGRIKIRESVIYVWWVKVFGWWFLVAGG